MGLADAFYCFVGGEVAVVGGLSGVLGCFGRVGFDAFAFTVHLGETFVNDSEYVFREFAVTDYRFVVVNSPGVVLI